MIKNYFNYILKFKSILPLSKEKPKQVLLFYAMGMVVMGKDISSLAYNWQRFLPDTIFLCTQCT